MTDSSRAAGAFSDGRAMACRGLYLITPDCADSGRLLALIEAAVAGGPALLQYRNKLARTEAQRRREASQIAQLCRAAGVGLIVNDSVALALDVDADGVHIGREDGDPVSVRRTLGPDRLLGVSCYDDWSRACAAVAAGADYVAFGAMFPSRTKPAAVRAPIELVRRARSELGVAVATIGGITLDNASELVDAGADLVAVISDVFDAPDPAARATAYRMLFAA
ncbi:MAG TPA: thiamine phosphate synthase [Rhodocyclaceae bacterium]|nr:thiamine phosphate synthase [Rhodocyclaceae bacterium]HRQ45902.1 thiamine phosphate synthase [Rhodocyclaceae bacterium]